MWTGTKEPLDEGEREEWKSWFKAQHSKNEVHHIQSYHFMANRWDTIETVTYFIFLGSKITMKGDYRHKIKRDLLLGRIAMTNLDIVLKKTETSLYQQRSIYGMVFLVVIYGCESWTIKKAEC